MSGQRDTIYRHRFMGSMIFVLILLNLLVSLRRSPDDAGDREIVQFQERDAVPLELPPVTTHRVIPSAPEQQRLPNPRPTDEIITDPIELPDSELGLSETLDLPAGGPRSGRGREPVANPDRPARMTHIVEPARSDIPEPYRGDIVVYVRLLLNAEGRVETATLEALENREGEAVELTDDNWLGPVLEAASKWRFQPAVDGGESVWSETVIQFYL